MSESRAEVLIVDDDPAFLRLAEVMLHSNGYSTRCVESGESALADLDERFPDVILLDQQLGSVDGMSLIEPLKQRAPDVSVVLVTAYSTVDAAVRAIKLGAHDFLAKPLDEARLVAILAKAIEHRDLVDRLHRLEGERTERSEFSGMVGASPAMQTIYRIIENVADTRRILHEIEQVLDRGRRLDLKVPVFHSATTFAGIQSESSFGEHLFIARLVAEEHVGQ